MNGARILVVDDDVLHRELVRAAIADMCEVVEASDAEEALRIVQAAPIDLVVLDVVMPGETGIDACRRIKATTNDRVAVLLVTALSEREHRLAGLSAGADDFLTKPFDRTELRLRVDMFLRLRKQESIIRDQLIALQRLDALKDDLVSLLVHDLKHPLTGVFAWLSIARASSPPETAVELENALSAAVRVRDTINDLLQIRALEQGELTPTLAPMSIADVVESAVAGLEGAARERRVALVQRVPAAVIRADAALVRRAIDNLLANAIKFAPPESAVEVVATVDDGQLHLEVIDQGPGVPDERKAELFTKFGTLDPGAIRSRRGFGLGLYFVQLVASAHHGRAGVRDRRGGGAIFELTMTAG